MDKEVGRLVYKILGDDRDFQKTLKKSSKTLQDAGRSMTQIGTRLTLGVTVPITGIGTAMVKAAVDAEETRAKFETAFRGITDSADEVRDGLVEGYGLANDEAERLLSNTGDLLKGFGASADQALGLSNEVQQLAVDLASYNNLQGGTERASEILTKAMLGEREALTSLGIKISETDVQQRLLEQGQENLTGRALLLAKAQATLQLAYDQSGDALGDFNRTQDSTANQFRQLRAEIRDLSVEVGTELLPVVRDLLAWARDAIQSFSELDKGTQRLVLTLGGIAAAAGPASTAIGGVIRAAGLLKGALAFLGPAGIAVAGVGALTAAFWEASEPIEDAEQKAEMFAESLRQAHNQGMDLEEVMAEIAKRGDVTVQELRQIAIQQGIANDETREAYELDQRRAEYAELQLNFRKWEADAAERVQAAEEAITEEKREQQHLGNYADYWDAVNERWRELGRNLEIYRDNLNQVTELDDPQRQIEELERLERMLELDIGMLEQESQFPRTSKARLNLLNDIKDVMSEITGETDEAAESTKTLRETWGEVQRSINETIEESEPEIEQWQQSIIDDANDIQDVMSSAVQSMQDGFGSTFQLLGEGMKQGKLEAEDFKDVLVGMVSSTIKALAEQYTIQALAALVPGPTFNPAAAAGYFAVAAAAHAASGFVSAFGEGGSFQVDQPTLFVAGEKGPEHIDVKPVEHAAPAGWGPQGQSINIYGDIYGYEDFAERVQQATNRAVRINRVK